MATPESQGGIDYSDGGFPSGTSLYPATGDLSEHAIRLGSPASVNRTGNVLLAYDFRHGKAFVTTTTAGLGEDPKIVSSYSVYGGYTLRLDRIADADSYSGLTVGTPSRDLGNWGVEVIFLHGTADANLKLYIVRYTGTKYILAGLRWDTRDGKIYLGDDGVGWAESPTVITTTPNLALQHSMKLVIDDDGEEYIRAYVSGQEISMPEKDLNITASTTEPRTYLWFYNALEPSSASYIYVDALIITCNES